ncbi:MAG: HD-GYP domain-containing protein [Coriobacteriia bacterium]
MRRQLGLVEYYALESLVLSVAMALVLGGAVTWRMDTAIKDANGRSAAAFVGSIVAHQIEDADMSLPLTGSHRAALDHLMTHDLEARGVAYVKVFGADGTVIYTPDGAGEGTRHPGEPAIARAMSGEVVTKVVRSDEDEESSEQFQAFGRLVEVYAPIHEPGTNKVVGVFEMYESYVPIQEQIIETNILIWAIVLLGALVLYMTQLQIVRRAASRLYESEEEAEEVNSRLLASLRDLEEHSIGTLQALIAAVDAKDSYTARHSLAVTEYALAIGRRLGLDEDRLVQLERAGLLHDVGKIGVAENVLLKPSDLSQEEWLEIRDHSDIGARIIESIPFLRDLVEIIRHHHERWDGQGYPSGMSGESVPEEARILAVADAFDAMTSDRPYRAALRVSIARDELLRGRGIQFEPRVVDAMLESLDTGEVAVGRTPVQRAPGKQGEAV